MSSRSTRTGTQLSTLLAINPRHPEPDEAMTPLRLFLFTALCSLGLATAALGQPGQLDWQQYSDGRGTMVHYPAGVFSQVVERNESGVKFGRADGRARLAISANPNERRETPRAFLRRKFPDRQTVLSYDRVTPTFFAVSARMEDKIFYTRCNFAAAVHCIELEYPAAEKRQWDGIVTRISRSLRPLR
jgi:hypothetical protein